MAKRYKVVGLSRNDIASFAKEIRKILGIENSLYVNLLKLIEIVLPQIDPEFDYEIIDEKSMADMGLTLPEKHIMLIREDTYNGAVHGNKRDRFTLAHEIGHYLLHDIQSISLARKDENVPSYQDPEWQANAFAAEFLMCRSLVAGMSQAEISEACGVSMESVGYHLKKIKKR